MSKKHLIIPTKKNHFHPKAIRSKGLIVFLMIFVAIQFVYNLSSTNKFQVLGYATNVSVGDVYRLSNDERIKQGLTPLNLNEELTSAAISKANDMFTDDYWAHNAPDGTTPWYFIANSGYDYNAAGENLAKDFSTSSGVVAGWMNSPGHRANILNTTYQDVGYAVVNGILLGSETTLVVAMYGYENPPVVVASNENNVPAEGQPNGNDSEPTKVEQVKPQETTTSSDPTNTQEVAKNIVETVTNNQVTKQISAESTSKDDAVDGSSNKNAGSVEGISIALPIEYYKSFNWGQKASILLIAVMILLFAMKHTLIWREKKKGVRHVWLRSHPLGQAIVLLVALIVTIASSIGVVL